MVDRTCLENRSLGNRTVSSNLTSSALSLKEELSSGARKRTHEAFARPELIFQQKSMRRGREYLGFYERRKIKNLVTHDEISPPHTKPRKRFSIDGEVVDYIELVNEEVRTNLQRPSL